MSRLWLVKVDPFDHLLAFTGCKHSLDEVTKSIVEVRRIKLNSAIGECQGADSPPVGVKFIFDNPWH